MGGVVRTKLGSLLIAAGFIWALLASGLATAGVATDESTRIDIVEAIRIEGAQRIENETVLSYMVIRPGDPFDPSRMDRSLKSLFATGLFSDVTLRREVNILVVRVVENPVINRIAFEGNRKLSNDDLSAEVQLRPRVVYTRTKVQNDVRRILDLYKRNGRFGATVEPKAITLPQNRVDLIFEINEGDTTDIERIVFIGNKHFSDAELREVIITSESQWWNILNSNDTYDPDRLTFDRELLRRFYLSKGYADFRIISAVAELSPDRSGFYITFTVDEGERYKFGKGEIVSNIKNLPPEALLDSITFDEGDWYNAEEIEKTINALTDEVGVLGFAFVEIRPDVTRDPDIRTISITFIIREGPRVFVERIDIIGNTRTLDYVIRREIQLVEGDAFNTQKVQLSRRRMENLNFFESVEIENLPGTDADKTILQVSVVEQPTGELSLGAGFSTDEGPLATVGISERNFLGRGQALRANFSISGRTQQVDFGFTQPYFLGYNMVAGIDIFRLATDLGDNNTFSQESTGANVRVGYEITESLSQSWRYTYRTDNITDVQPNASTIIMEQEGRTQTSSIFTELTYDKRNNRQFPTEGYFITFGTQYAGPGGSEYFLKLTTSGGYYLPIADGWNIVLSGEAGAVSGLNNKDVNIQTRFFVGGNELRGFSTSGIGPRDPASNDSLGGNYFYTGTVELGFPLGLPESLGVEGKIFTDFGSLWGIDNPDNDPILDSSSLRASVGVGLQITTPFGPVRVDLAQALLKESFDETQVIHFSFGTTF
ncbi:MAG: outer membrane protein assembly factor BamA [Alphaproteobacteria bacterium]|nr:outer membrane protein assembly factor BamA [Alphaproteobacteria bacterium]